MLKPGGKLSMNEYDHAASAELPKEVLRKLKEVNQHSAMPGNQAFEPGVLEDILHQAGFEDVRVEDISENIMPMVWLFYIVAYIPYLFIQFFGLQSRFINTMAAAEGYQAMQNKWTRYLNITARKPSHGASDVAQEAKKSR